MDFSARVDELQQRVAATKAAVQAAATESRDQLRQRIDQAQQDAQDAQQRAEQTASREAAKARGQQLVGMGPSANSAGGPPPVSPEGKPVSLTEAFEAAWDQHTR